MKQVIYALVGALLLSVSAAAQSFPFASVAPIQEIKQDNEEHQVLVNVCGAVSINQKQHYWLTAYHCVEGIEHSYILGDEADAIMKDVPNDLAVLKTKTVSAPAVKLASKALELGEEVYTISYPLSLPAPLLLSGKIANPYLPYGEAVFVVYQFPVAPGSSGAPVFNTAGELVSVTQRGFSPHSYTPVGSGAHFEKLSTLAIWWEK